MSDVPAPLPPELLDFQMSLAGRYSIESELGRGGMGIVFLAREVALDRYVALKLLPPELAARPGVKERFLREARTAAKLSHPNIVQIYTVDEVDGFVFFAMAYIDGGTLGDRLRERGPLRNKEAVRLLREVSWALGHAHVQGVIHRDVKPENILLDKSSGRALVTDFGIAVAAEDAEAVSSDHAVGTAEFMSPEQAKGGTVDARSDLYSLACVGYYGLSGHVPHSGDTPAQTLVKHLSEAPEPLLTKAPHVPPAVAQAVDRCLRKDPDQRFQAGEDLAEAIAPQSESDRELAVPLRVFIKKSRDWETQIAWAGFGWALLFPVVAIAGSEGFAGIFAATMAVLAILSGIPITYLIKSARDLLSSGFTRTDVALAFTQDIDRREEEYRFEIGERLTWVDSVARGVKNVGYSVAAVGVGAAFLTPGFVSAFAAGVGLFSFNVGTAGLLWQELRARRRGDIMGERLRKLWKSRAGRWVFKLAGLNLDRVAPALGSGVHRPTEVIIGLEADRLYSELPKETQKQLAGLPEIVRKLEEDAKAMRKQVEELDGVLAELGDDDPSRPQAAERSRVRADVEATRANASDKLRQAVAALEKIRLDLLYMQAGSQTVESLTMELMAAEDLSEAMANLLEGHREVERILDERRKTGIFQLAAQPTPTAGD